MTYKYFVFFFMEVGGGESIFITPFPEDAPIPCVSSCNDRSSFLVWGSVLDLQRSLLWSGRRRLTFGLGGGATGSLHPQRPSPWALLPIQCVHGPLSLLHAAQVHKQIVVVTRLESLRRMRGEHLADGLTAIDNPSQ